MRFTLTPDGHRYLNMGNGLAAEPVPFALRPLLPFICRDSQWRWIAAMVMGITCSVVLTGFLALQHGATEIQALVAMALLAGLPSLRFSFFAPVLVDMPAMALSLGAAVLWPIEPIWAFGIASLAGLVSEKAPIWAAVFALQPWLLLGLWAPLCSWLFFGGTRPRADDPLADTINHPIRSSLRFHSGQWRDLRLMILPWGACLVVMADLTPWLLIALAVGYAQILVATDTVRLYQQAAPVVCILAAIMIPAHLALPAVLFHWFNPWAGDGL